MHRPDCYQAAMFKLVGLERHGVVLVMDYEFLLYIPIALP